MFGLNLPRPGSAAQKITAAEQMHGIVVESPGDIDALELRELPIPEIGMHEVLVRTHSFGVSRLDCEIRRNERECAELLHCGAPLGYALSGTAVKVGSRVAHIRDGELVFGLTAFPNRAGAYAEYAVLPLETIQPVPAALSPSVAAAAPLAGLVAYQALLSHAELKATHTVLVSGGAGAIGHFAIQIAVNAGATVVATGSERNHTFLESLGAAAVADYNSESALAALPECDIAIDAIGGGATVAALGVLKRSGILVSLSKGGADRHEELRRSSQRIKHYRLKPRRASFEALCALLAEGAVKSTVMRVRGFEELPHAHALSESGHARGCIVCDLD